MTAVGDVLDSYPVVVVVLQHDAGAIPGWRAPGVLAWLSLRGWRS